MLRLSPHLYRFSDTCSSCAILNGETAVMVDCGAASALPALGVRQVTDVLLTHHHRDLVQGLPRLAAAAARIWAPYTEQALFQSASTHWQPPEI